METITDRRNSMNLRPVQKDFFRFSSKIGKQKLVIELDSDATLDDITESFRNFLNASGYTYVDKVEVISSHDNESTDDEDIPF